MDERAVAYDARGLVGPRANERAEQAAHESERRQKAILDATPDPVWLKDRDGRFLAVNAAWCRFRGMQAEDILGKTAFELFAPEIADKLWAQDCEVLQSQRVLQIEDMLRDAAGRMVWFATVKSPFYDEHGHVAGIVGIARDITEHKQVEQERQTVINFLRIANESRGTQELIRMATGFFQQHADCAAVGIRLRDGNDYPYFEARGFPPDFIAAENSLCVRCENGEPLLDGDGNPVLDCMCGNVICGRFDPSLPFFTPGGSFWTNSTSALLASFTQADLQARTRNRCNGEGYESVALIPLTSGQGRLGLLQLNDRRQGRFTPQDIALWERLAGYLAVAVAKARAEEGLRKSEDLYRSLFDKMTEGFAVHEILCDAQGEPCDYRFLDVNPAFEQLTGLQREAVVGKTMREVLPNEKVDWIQTYGRVALTGAATRFENYSPALNRHFDVFAYSPAPRQFAVMFTDVSARRHAEHAKLEMERQLLHAQKLEGLGVLAGGIAHDFNNILAIILGYADLLQTHLPASGQSHRDVDVIIRAVQRAAGLTQQMLAYAGKGKAAVEPVTLSRLIDDARSMLEVSVSKKATIQYSLAADLPAIMADASQIYQVVLNLVINASEALGDASGTIELVTDTVDDSAVAATPDGKNYDLQAGPYVRLTVADTGCGMDQATVGKIFDPFFTTKFTGRGLGLAAVHGIVRSHHGAIQVASTPGRGTTFAVLFPVANMPVAAPAREAGVTRAWRGSGVILVVDDEEIIRTWAQSILEGIGFSVLTAADGDEAVRLYRQRYAEIACVLLDLTMPKLNGEETLRELRHIRPDVRAILSSGYSEEELVEQFAGTSVAAFLHKPFRGETLVAAIRQALEAHFPQREC